MAPDAEMRMVLEDSTPPTRVPFIFDHLSKRFTNGLPLRGIEPDGLVFEQSFRVRVERFQFRSRWLVTLASLMNRAQLTQRTLAYEIRPTPPRVVR